MKVAANPALQPSGRQLVDAALAAAMEPLPRSAATDGGNRPVTRFLRGAPTRRSA